MAEQLSRELVLLGQEIGDKLIEILNLIGKDRPNPKSARAFGRIIFKKLHNAGFTRSQMLSGQLIFIEGIENINHFIIELEEREKRKSGRG